MMNVLAAEIIPPQGAPLKLPGQPPMRWPDVGALIPDLLPVAEAQIIRSAGGMAQIWYPAPTVFVSRVEGAISEAMATAMLVEGQRIIASDGKLVVFHDWELVKGYEKQARVQFTRVGLQLRRQVEASHFLVRARILAVGIQLANIVLGTNKVHPSRASFESVLRDTVVSRVRRAS
jgi:hypothetical protein